MRCRSAQHLMLLYREGELLPAQAVQLHEHTASCAACAQSAERIAAAFAPLDALRARQPVIDEPRVLTMKIMRGIESGLRPAPLSAGSGWQFLKGLASARHAAGAAAAALALLYVSLSMRDARSVASLEQRLSERASREGSTAEQLAREATAFAGIRIPSAHVESGIRPYELGRLLQVIVQPGQSEARVTVQDVLTHKYPALASVTLQDGLDERERKILAEEGKRFLRDLENLIRKEK